MKRNAQTSHRSKPIRLPFGESLSKKYAAERDREQSARNEQEAALKPHRAVMDAFGRWDDVWRAVEDCHAGAKFNWGYRPCNPVELLEDQLKRMLAATVGLCGEDNVRLAFNKFSAEGYQGYDLDAASTVRVILEAFVAMLDSAKPKQVAEVLYALAPLPHLCGAKAVINVVQIADRLPTICRCGKPVGFPFDMESCGTCSENKTETKQVDPKPPMPPKRYGAGEDGLRRDAKIYELANANWTNKQIAEEIERLSSTENWESISVPHIHTRLAKYCLHTGLPVIIRRAGRPKSLP